MIKLDGSFCEGGGQIVRTALALSVITGKPFEVNYIRKGRPRPGLKNQHLFCIKALKQLCDAKVYGDFLGSEKIKFSPGKINAKNLEIDIGTAGSITLLLQSLLLPCIFAGKKVKIEITGGSDVKWSMPVDYVKEVFLPQLRRFADINLIVGKRGYYPKGGGKISLIVKPYAEEKEKKIKLIEQNNLVQIKGISHASADLEKANVAERQSKAASLILAKLGCPVNIRVEYSRTPSIGSGITLWAVFSKQDEIDFNNPVILGADSLGERGKRAEEVGIEAAKKLLEEIKTGAAVDRNLADNLVPFLGLVGGSIRTSEITNHTKTNIYVVKKFLKVKFKVKDNIISAELPQ